MMTLKSNDATLSSPASTTGPWVSRSGRFPQLLRSGEFPLAFRGSRSGHPTVFLLNRRVVRDQFQYGPGVWPRFHAFFVDAHRRHQSHKLIPMLKIWLGVALVLCAAI